MYIMNKYVVNGLLLISIAVQMIHPRLSCQECQIVSSKIPIYMLFKLSEGKCFGSVLYNIDSFCILYTKKIVLRIHSRNELL